MKKNVIDEFWKKRTAITDRRIATNYRDDGRLNFDIALIDKYFKDGSELLDLGAGTCTLSMNYLERSSKLVVVDKFGEFFSHLPPFDKITTIVSDINCFTSQEMFDLILLFGVANFLTDSEEIKLYDKCKKMLKPEGVFIVKNQCGISQDVYVDGYSAELQANYVAKYPYVDEQQGRLENYFDVKKVDIYPESINRWQNTHFYAFVCTTNDCNNFS